PAVGVMSGHPQRRYPTRRFLPWLVEKEGKSAQQLSQLLK
ncbi:hypothetical protein KPNIH23_29133, partial [Klebsiella pneumoniae subsp. pneumoniae KPNIH23]